MKKKGLATTVTDATINNTIKICFMIIYFKGLLLVLFSVCKYTTYILSMQIKHNLFSKKIFINAHILYTPVPVVRALRLAWYIGLPTHRQRIRRGAASIQDMHRHTKHPRTHAPTHAPGTPYPSHRSRPRRTTPDPFQGAPGPPTRIFPAPPAPVRTAGPVAWRRVFRVKDTFPVPFID